MSKHQCKTWTLKTSGDFRYVHHKLDGIWLYVTPDHAFTGHPTDLSHTLQFCETVRRAQESKIQWYGELYVPGMPASFVKSAIKHKDERLEFRPFAAPRNEPNQSLEFLHALAGHHGLRFCPFTDGNYSSVRKHIELGTKLDLPKDIEGLVFKNGNLLDWHKWKPVRTIDAFIVGYQDGRKKYTGQIGSLHVAVYDDHGVWRVIANVSGMDDDVRATISADRDGHMLKVVEVEYQYVGAQGRLRHPRFKCFRDDKQYIKCFDDQDPELLENQPS